MDRIRAEERCSATILTDSYYSVRCTRRGTSTRKGKLYCTQHDPVEIAKRDNARLSKWQQKWDLEDRQRAKAEELQGKIETKAALADQLADAVLAYYRGLPYGPHEKVLIALARKVKKA